jgi:hypothetical protein
MPTVKEKTLQNSGTPRNGNVNMAIDVDRKSLSYSLVKLILVMKFLFDFCRGLLGYDAV